MVGLLPGQLSDAKGTRSCHCLHALPRLLVTPHCEACLTTCLVCVYLLCNTKDHCCIPQLSTLQPCVFLVISSHLAT
jgi:hypothetical protein